MADSLTDPLTHRLRAELLTARRSGDRATATAVRAALAALSNAEAVPVEDDPLRVGDGEIAGSRTGAGATEATPRTVGAAERRRIVAAEIAELCAAAAVYDGVDAGRADAARSGVETLERVLAETAGPG